MEAKDTVLTEDYAYDNYCSILTGEYDIPGLLLEQAKTSFPAGQEEMRQRINRNTPLEITQKYYISGMGDTDEDIERFIKDIFKAGIKELLECIRKYGVGYALSKGSLQKWGIKEE